MLVQIQAIKSFYPRTIITKYSLKNLVLSSDYIQYSVPMGGLNCENINKEFDRFNRFFITKSFIIAYELVW